VTVSSTSKYYSVGTDAAGGVVNVHPYTDLLVRSAYDAHSIDIGTYFSTLDTTTTPVMPSKVVVAQVREVIEGVLNLWLVRNDVAPGSFDLVSTPFTIGGAGFDKVLDATTIVHGTASYTISLVDGVSTQTSVITIDDANDRIAVDTSSVSKTAFVSPIVTGTVAAPISAPAASSTARFASRLAMSADLQAAVAGVQATLDDLKSTVNAHAAAKDLANTHLQSLYNTTDFLREGDDWELWAGQWAQMFRGHTLAEVRLDFIADFDAPNKLLTATVATVMDDGQTFKFSEVFKDDGTSWKWHGDQRKWGIPWFEVLRPEKEVTSPTTTIKYLTSVYVLSQVGAVSTSSPPTVIGGPWSTATTTRYSGQNQESLQAEPKPATPLAYTRDNFQLFSTSTPATMPPAGTKITVTVSSTAGGVTTVTGTIPASTTETVTVTIAGAHSLATALAAGTLTVNWTLPTTFPVGFVTVGFGYNNSGRTDEGYVQGQNVVTGGMPPTQATITMPATTPGGGTIAHGPFTFVEVNITGLNGEAIESRWVFNKP